MTQIDSLVRQGRALKASDLHLTVGEPPILRLDGRLERMQLAVLSNDSVNTLIAEMCQSAGLSVRPDDMDFAFTDSDGTRQRVNVFQQRGKRAAAVRFLRDDIPTVEQLGLPPILNTFAEFPRGLVLVTGPTGSGKSTTLAAMIDHINHTQKKHILTMEDPIEYIHPNRLCMVNQREVGQDSGGFAEALRSALRQDPDIILVGEMRDKETISAALSAAETGHLVLSTLHTTGAAKTIDRIIDTFEPHQQQQVRSQLATVLRAVISQQLVERIGGGRIAVHEIMPLTDAVSNLIREGKIFQIASLLQTGARYGMTSMDATLASLVKSRVISSQTAQESCIAKDELNRYLQQQRGS